MRNYRGYYIDNVTFNSETEVDEFIKQQEIREYRTRCQVFAINKTMEASIYADEQAQKLNREYNITWEELEQIEIEETCKEA